MRELDANLAHLPIAERDRKIRKELKLTRDELREFRGIQMRYSSKKLRLCSIVELMFQLFLTALCIIRWCGLIIIVEIPTKVLSPTAMFQQEGIQI